MIGVPGSFGRATNPFEIPMRMVSPSDEINDCKPQTKRQITGGKGRQVGRAHPFPQSFQAGFVIDHGDTKVDFFRVALTLPSVAGRGRARLDGVPSPSLLSRTLEAVVGETRRRCSRGVYALNESLLEPL